MPRYEYKVVPAPTKGLKGKGVRGAEARFSFALQELMNGLSGYGWEFMRAETLPSIERAGLTGTTTEWRNVLVFRRPREGDAAEFQPELLPAPLSQDDAEAPEAKSGDKAAAPAQSDPADNGVEDPQSESKISSTLNILARARSLARTGPDAPPELSEDALPDPGAASMALPEDAEPPSPEPEPEQEPEPPENTRDTPKS
ncbi:hypothetical protein ABMC89_05885 [Sulfitobacter sp. HNIBRBA3233]|uniref:hypothetical protein n=1 Tax=Sulfitobacter marinivivus TaxID=3158558 RepID=UPI0032DFD24C